MKKVIILLAVLLAACEQPAVVYVAPPEIDEQLVVDALREGTEASQELSESFAALAATAQEFGIEVSYACKRSKVLPSTTNENQSVTLEGVDDDGSRLYTVWEVDPSVPAAWESYQIYEPCVYEIDTVKRVIYDRRASE